MGVSFCAILPPCNAGVRNPFRTPHPVLTDRCLSTRSALLFQGTEIGISTGLSKAPYCMFWLAFQSGGAQVTIAAVEIVLMMRGARRFCPTARARCTATVNSNSYSCIPQFLPYMTVQRF